MKVLNLPLVFFILLFTGVLATGGLKAQAPNPMQSPQVEVAPQTEPQVQGATSNVSKCDCIKPAIDVIQKAYSSVEEDEWPSAIKVCKDAINTIKTLAKTCKCQEVVAYQNLAEAFLKYAEGGNYLDGEENPDCKYALKLYDEVDSLITASIPKIADAQVKENAKNVQGYAKEEQMFVKDECADTQTATKPTGEQKAPAAPKQ